MMSRVRAVWRRVECRVVRLCRRDVRAAFRGKQIVVVIFDDERFIFHSAKIKCTEYKYT